jgi:glycosyltransferase involved in cell wall biosynthesis
VSADARVPTNDTILHIERATAYGGSTRCLENYLQASSADGFRHLLALHFPLSGQGRLEELTDRSWTLHRPPPAPPASLPGKLLSLVRHELSTARQLLRVIRKHRVSLVHLNNGPTVHVAAVLAANLTHIPHVCWLRSWAPTTTLPWQRLTRAHTRFVAVSEAVRRDWIRAGVPGERVTTLYDGTPLPHRHRNGRTGACERPVSSPCRFGALGRLVGWKGHLDFVRAAAAVVSHFPSTRFAIMGEEDPAEPGLLSRLQAEIDRAGVHHAVDLLPFDPHPHSFLASLDCLVNPSSRPEPFGMSIIEAMAHGVPVIATDAGGPAEIIVPGHSGLLVPMRQPQSLAAAMIKLVSDPDLRGALGRRGRARVEERFEYRRQANRMSELFAHVLTTREIAGPA